MFVFLNNEIYSGPTFAAKGSISGMREGSVMLYAYNKYPFNAICSVSFLWKPCVETVQSPTPCGDARQRTLWIWAHPSCYEECLSGLTHCFYAIQNIEPPTDQMNPSVVVAEDGDVKPQVDIKHTKKANGIRAQNGAKLNMKPKKDQDGICNQNNVPVDNIKYTPVDNTKYTSVDNIKYTKDEDKDTKSEAKNIETEVQNRKYEIGVLFLESLKDTLVRFRLTGPLSHTLLMKALNTADVLPREGTSDKWWHEYYGIDDNSIAMTQQREVWGEVGKLKSLAELHPYMVLGLTVRDPRYTLPHLKQKVKENTAGKCTAMIELH